MQVSEFRYASPYCSRSFHAQLYWHKEVFLSEVVLQNAKACLKMIQEKQEASS